jgi:hypothetical protein
VILLRTLDLKILLGNPIPKPKKLEMLKEIRNNELGLRINDSMNLNSYLKMKLT